MKKQVIRLLISLLLAVSLSVAALATGTLSEGEKSGGETPETATTENPVAKVGDICYATLAEAIAAAEPGDTVTLLDNIDIAATVRVEADDRIILDLNGKTIDGVEAVRIAIMSYGDLTLKDSSAEKTGAVRAGTTSNKAGNTVNICAGTFVMESGNIYSVNNGILVDEQAAAVTIKGGTITAEPTTDNSAVFYLSSTTETVLNIEGGEMTGYNGILLWDNTEINISGGTIIAEGNLGIQGNGSKDNTEINITGGSVSGKVAAIYHPQGGALNISGTAALTGGTGVVVKGGVVNISGGTVTANGDAVAYGPVSSGFNGTGDALYVEHYDNSTDSENYGTPVVTVTGGTFTSANGKAAASYANSSNSVEALTGFVTGGTFSTDPSDYVAYGYTAVEGESSWTVEENPTEGVAKIGINKYETLAAAITAAVSGDTITLLDDIALTAPLLLPNEKTLTIDGAGHKITPAAGGFTTDGNGAVLVLAANDTDYNANSKYTVKNLTFEGFTSLTRVVRANFCDAVIDNCTFNTNSASEGVITNAYANVTVKNSSFTNNTAGYAAIYVGGDQSTYTAQVANITGNDFTGNNAGIAVVFLVSSANVTGNYFSDNTHTDSNPNAAAILAGPYNNEKQAGAYTVNVKANAFVNAMKKDGVALPAVYAEDWSAAYNADTTFDLSNNYWGGASPVKGTSYAANKDSAKVTVSSYASSYTRTEPGVTVTTYTPPAPSRPSGGGGSSSNTTTPTVPEVPKVDTSSPTVSTETTTDTTTGSTTVTETKKDGTVVETTTNTDGSTSTTASKTETTTNKDGSTTTTTASRTETQTATGDKVTEEKVEETVENKDGSTTTTTTTKTETETGLTVTEKKVEETVKDETTGEEVTTSTTETKSSDGSNPTGSISRQQLATMLWRYAGEPDSDHSIEHHTDDHHVAGYAGEAVAWAVEHGIKDGYTDGSLRPGNAASRAHVAAMTARFVDHIAG